MGNRLDKVCGALLCDCCGTRENDWKIFAWGLIAVFNGGCGAWILF